MSSPRSDAMEADVGILGAAAADPDAAADAAGMEDDDDGFVAEPSCRWDVYESLHSADYTGLCCASGKADGTTLTPALPTTLGLRVNGVGDIPLPITEWHAKELKSCRHTQRIGSPYHKVNSVDSQRIRIRHPSWESMLEKLVQNCAFKLGINPEYLSAELDMLLLMEKGSYVHRCFNNDEGTRVLGTLFIQLPSHFSGGRMSIFNTAGVEDGDGVGNDTKHKFDLGASGVSGDASFSCHFVCHHKDLEYEFAKITSGYRVLLRYSLCYQRGLEVPRLSALNNATSSLKWAVEMLPAADRIMLLPLHKEYQVADIVREGINVLLPSQRRHVETLKAATDAHWKLMIINAELINKRRIGYYGDLMSSSCDETIVQIFDEYGNDCTSEYQWMKNVLNFESSDMDGEGMLLDDNEYYEAWGACTRTSSSTNYHQTKTVTKFFKASFVCAFDTSLQNFEIKCLGGIDGVSEVSQMVVKRRDLNLVERLLNVVESKAKSQFSVEACTQLLHMLTGWRSKKGDRISFVNTVISELAPSQEPDAGLFAEILAAVQRFGHENLTESITRLFGNDTRNKNITLSTFLRRADFCLKLLNKSHSETSYLQQSVNALNSFGANKAEKMAEITTTILMMISRHGKLPMSYVVQATLEFIHNKIQQDLPSILNRAELLWKMQDNHYDFLEECMVDFVGDFVHCLQYRDGKIRPWSSMQVREKRCFLNTICTVLSHGTAEKARDFGKWAIVYKDRFFSLLELIASESTRPGWDGYDAQELIHDILNKCLVPVSIERHGYGWRSEMQGDGTVIPSRHVRKILEDYPNIAHEFDSEGRLTLHHALASSETSYEVVMDLFRANPRGASSRDPVSGLYPFMLAASNNQVGAAFSLLQANPSLVRPMKDGRKRKRSLSME